MSDVCPCHGKPWYVQPGGKHAGMRYCHVKRNASRRKGQSRYSKTDKGAATNKKHRASAKGKATRKAYTSRDDVKAKDAEYKRKKYAENSEFRHRTILSNARRKRNINITKREEALHAQASIH